ncbi:heme/copper-type cytochrome/quinol oxidase subunit 2 [Pontibacter aydingkolensis]|uniref:Uncharacterized protein n=1 Tax=Pontibacter aydingkolensis TaxID=1911536 RepID=A0ABS7CRT3_9BACT|nr:hypothetical protein [Pontibacter aydingkolensis]MBW7466548.1 hypothetical protein [Pontibacter aydingkolensis]
MPQSKKPRHKHNPAKGMTNLQGQKTNSKRASKTIKVNRWLNLKLESITINIPRLIGIVILIFSIFLLNKIGGYEISDIILFLGLAQKK